MIAEAIRIVRSTGYTKNTAVHVGPYEAAGIVLVTWFRITSKSMLPVKCCIITPMNARTSMPPAIFLMSIVHSHFAAIKLSGDNKTMNATMCSQTKGNEKTKTLVKGFNRKIANKATLSPTTIAQLERFRCMRKPVAKTAIKSGRKSNPKNDIGRPNPIAARLPIITVNPPTYGPSMMPIKGARKSDRERNAPVVPMITLKGMKRRIMYKAVKIVRKAICLVLWLVPLSSDISVYHAVRNFCSLHCSFLHSLIKFSITSNFLKER
jgi:hypothetical protein